MSVCIGVSCITLFRFVFSFLALGDTRTVPQLIRHGAKIQRRRHGRSCGCSLHLRSSPQAHGKQFNGKWVSYTHTAMAYGMPWSLLVNGLC